MAWWISVGVLVFSCLSSCFAPATEEEHRGMAALTMLATCGLSGFADPPPAKNDPPKPAPEEIVKAWKKAGAEVRWIRVDKFGFTQFLPDKQMAGDLPVFFFDWKEGQLAKLPDPASASGLYLYGTQLTDAALKELAGLKSLQTLGLGGPFGQQELGAELKELAELKDLQTLILRCNWLTDAGLKELAGLKSLQTLDLYHTNVTDRGLKEVAGLKSLQTLDLRDTKVTDAGLKGLAGLKKSLQTLNLRNTKITDAGLKELAGLDSLQTLDLRDTKVTDAGLKELAGLKSLLTLNLGRTKVTDVGLKDLRKALRGCEILR